MASRRARRPSPGRAAALGRAALRVLALVVLGAGGVGAGYLGVQVRQALQRGELLAIETIQIQGTERVQRAELLDYAGIDVGTGLYAFDVERVQRAMAEHPLIASARLVRRPPHELRVFVVEERAVAYVALERLYAVNARGQLFARAEVLGGQDLPVILGVAPDSVGGDTPPSTIRTALQVLAAWERAGCAQGELATVQVDPALGVDLQLTVAPGRVHLGRERLDAKLRQLVALRAALARRGVRADEVYLSDGPDPRRVVVRPAPAPVTTSEEKQPT